MENLYNQKKMRFANILDRLFSLFFRQKKHEDIVNIKKILVVQSHLIGDLVMATSVIHSLKNAYPDAHLTLLANKFALDIFQNDQAIDEIKVIRFPWSLYDYSLKNMFNIFTSNNIFYHLIINEDLDLNFISFYW